MSEPKKTDGFVGRLVFCHDENASLRVVSPPDSDERGTRATEAVLFPTMQAVELGGSESGKGT